MGGLKRGIGYESLFNVHPRTEVAAVCDINPEALENAKEEFDLEGSQCFQNYDDFVKTNLDIVFIGTPIPLHAEQAIKALESGKHVLFEVTAVNTIKDCERLVQTVKRTKMKYMMAENYFYFHYVQEWKKIIQEGKLGKIFYAESECIHQIRSLLRDPKTGKLLWRASRPPIHYCSQVVR